MTDSIVAIRNAVKPHLARLEAGDTVLVAVSGGADSLALASAILTESKQYAITAIAVTIGVDCAITSSLMMTSGLLV